MTTDRELLEAAAKAVGNGAQWYSGFGMGIDNGGAIPLIWNPLDEDGDALRLAVVLRISLDMLTHIVDATTGTVMCHEPWGDDHNAATRRAIVRAAAAMAKP